jgi:hypothetical protein
MNPIPFADFRSLRLGNVAFVRSEKRYEPIVFLRRLTASTARVVLMDGSSRRIEVAQNQVYSLAL